MNEKSSLNSMWHHPPAMFRPAPLWSWNSKLSPDRLRRQIESMCAAGMGGFFMHSRYGLETQYLGKEWFECISACIEKARQLDMKAYLYDEDRWPSGPAGGIITRKHKEYRMRYLVAGDPEKLEEKLDKPRDRLGVFKVELDKKGLLESYEVLTKHADATSGPGTFAFDIRIQPPRPWENDGTYLDTMNPDAVAEFIRVTHEAYYNRYGSDFARVIPAIFTDEPNYGLAALIWFCDDIDEKFRIHWTPSLPAEFEKRRGYDLLPFLPELVFPRGKDEFSQVTYDYYRTITELFTENFTQQIGQWCHEHNLTLTGHVLFEETLRTQIVAVGACMPHYEHMQWPGIDILTDQTNELGTAKQCSSVADQLGKERALSELYGCTGWDWPLEGHKFIADWQFAAGINFLCPHLSHYSLAAGAKRDYPASIIDHSPWWKYYKVVTDYLGRVSLMLTQGRPIRDVLVIHPIESAWGLFNYFRDKHAFKHEDPQADGSLHWAMNSIISTLTGRHYDWDFADESLLAKYGKVDHQNIVVGKMKYKLVVVPPLLTLRSTTVSMLNRFLEKGGSVLFVDSRPNRIDGRIDERIDEIIEQAQICPNEPKAFVAALEAVLPRRVSITENDKEQPCVWAMLRQLEDGLLLFVQSHDRQKHHLLNIRVHGAKAPVVSWDAMAGRKIKLRPKVPENKIEFELALCPSGSALLTLGVNVSDAEETPNKMTVADSQQIEGLFEIWLTEPNTLPLDYCQYRFGDGDFSEPMPTLKADELLRRTFGLGPRAGYDQQPWYLHSNKVIDTQPRGSVQMLYSFHLTEIPSKCSLVLETPQHYRVTINGKSAGPVQGHWLDEDFKTIDITSQLQDGDNEIQLDFEYRPDMELEGMYLLGDFGVARLDPSRPPAPDNLTIIALPTKLALGSWVGQGLDFYSAAVCYKLFIDRPASNRRVRIRLPEVSCTTAVIHAGGKSFVLPWGPFVADITEGLTEDTNQVHVEVIGGRKNILGPLHVPWEPRTGPESFSPDHPKWTFEYVLNDHGLFKPVVVETFK